MSSLTEVMDALAPIAQPGNWSDHQWTGPGDVRAIVAGAVEEIRAVDAMMNEIARATSLPATPEERTERAVEMAAAEIRGMHSSQWTAWIVELLEDVQPSVSDADYRVALESLRNRLANRLDIGSW
jgi:hypothetical protein